MRVFLCPRCKGKGYVFNRMSLLLTSHVSYQTETGEVIADAPHIIKLKKGLSSIKLSQIISHEVFHLFYSVRNLITADEETQAEVFGELVAHLFTAYIEKTIGDIYE